MEISFKLNDNEFSAEDEVLIKRCLGIDAKTPCEAEFSRLAKCAFLEYRKMFVGRGLPTRADEVMQDRLLFLIQNYFTDRVPLESEISSIFQLPLSTSRTLLRNTNSRYRTIIDGIITESIKEVLELAERPEPDDGYLEMVIRSDVIREEMNFVVGQRGPSLQPITKIRGSANKYRCADDTYDLLKLIMG